MDITELDNKIPRLPIGDVYASLPPRPPQKQMQKPAWPKLTEPEPPELPEPPTPKPEPKDYNDAEAGAKSVAHGPPEFPEASSTDAQTP